jgi:hypothetical protein
MSSYTFGVNPETLFALALFSNHPQRKEMVVQSQERQREQWDRQIIAPKIVVRTLFDEALSPLQQDSVYGPIYQQLVQYHIDQIDFDCFDWALRGENGVSLQQAQGKREDETTRFWNAVTGNEPLLQSLRILSGDWGGDSQHGGRLLRSHFQGHCAALSQQHEASFLIQTFLGMSLERINWVEVATRVIQKRREPKLRS